MNIFMSGRGFFAVMVADMLQKSGYQIIGTASPEFKTITSRSSGSFIGSQSDDWDRLRTWSVASNTPWVEARELRARHIPDETDVIVAAHSHAFIGQTTRSRARVAAIGYHPSLLPLHRGRDAIRWTIRDGDRVAGGTVYHLTDRTDGGPIAAQEHVLVPPHSTAQSLWRDHLAPLGVALLVRVVNDLAGGRRVQVSQDERLATWEPAMDTAPLFKPELVPLPSNQNGVEASKWALVDLGHQRNKAPNGHATLNEIISEVSNYA
jgi:methionyl-tRNA formyltransferase